MKKLIAPILLICILANCGPKQKSLLTKLSTGMSQDEVKMKMGKPDNIKCPTKNIKGDITEIWEYSLYTVDMNKQVKTTTISILGALIFWPALFFVPFMDQGYEYDMYYLEFVNSFLTRWGKSTELNTPSKRFNY